MTREEHQLYTLIPVKSFKKINCNKTHKSQLYEIKYDLHKTAH